MVIKFVCQLPGGGRYNDKNILSKTLIAGPGEVCSASYIFLKKVFDNYDDAKLFSYFLESRFLRFMVSIIKITQHAPRGVYRFVPYIDVINDLKKWKSVKEEKEKRDALDDELMDYFGLSKDQKNLVFNSVNIMNNKLTLSNLNKGESEIE